MKLDNLKIGDRIVVRNGARGEQVAVVANATRDGGKTLRAHKWLMRGKRWTNRVTVYECEALRYATADDFRKRGARPVHDVFGTRGK